jgi:hypothetical protein
LRDRISQSIKRFTHRFHRRGFQSLCLKRWRFFDDSNGLIFTVPLAKEFLNLPFCIKPQRPAVYRYQVTILAGCTMSAYCSRNDNRLTIDLLECEESRTLKG